MKLESRAYQGMPYQRPVTGPRPRRIRPRWGRIAFVATVLLSLLVGCGMLVSWLWVRGVDGDLKREDAFSALDERPPRLVDGALNILLLGTDSRDPEVSGEAGGAWRTDTIVLMHVPASHDRAYLVSIPRDLWVHVPLSPDGQDVPLNIQIDRVHVHARQVHRDDELVLFPPGIQGYRRRVRRSAQHLLGQPVQLPERIAHHQHHIPP